jgi:murein L,D-transpeptidase YcbB/YkuD
MNPIYMRIRQAYGKHRASTDSRAQDGVFRANLERARALPVDLGRRFILVDAASARLWMYDGDEVKDTMRVVVGRASEQTPLMAAFIRFAALNPYWNVPPDLVQRRIAPEVLAQGLSYLRKAKYQVLSDWSEDATVVDPKTVDWEAVAAGRLTLPVRQEPGAQNPMGNVKFMFPNDRGIYLHDTPNKALFSETDRRQSSGCIRLEDASRLARWIFKRDLKSKTAAPEQHVNVPEPIPVYITYLTVAPDPDRLAFHDDVYGRDGQLVAQLGVPPAAKERAPGEQEQKLSFSLLD